jgi:hypothetical protein
MAEKIGRKIMNMADTSNSRYPGTVPRILKSPSIGCAHHG